MKLNAYSLNVCKTVLRLEHDLNGKKKKLCWVSIFRYFTIDMNLKQIIKSYNVKPIFHNDFKCIFSHYTAVR